MGEGEIDPMQYMAELKNCIERNKILQDFYKSKGETARLDFIKELSQYSAKELKEIEEQLAQAGGEE